MLSVTDYFAELYNGSVYAVAVLDQQQACIYQTPPMEDQLSCLGISLDELLTEGVLRAARVCLDERRSDALALRIANQALELSLLPYPYEQKNYLILQLRKQEVPAEQKDLMEMLHSAQQKMSSYLNEIFGAVQSTGVDTQPGKDVATGVRRILRMTNRLYELIDGSGKLRTRVPMNLADFLNKYVRACNEIDNRLRIVLDCQSTFLCAKVFPEDMEMAVSSLVSNAFRFGNGQIIITVRRQEDRIVLSVTDDGPGVQCPEKLYDVGYRTADKNGAFGLGLSLAMAKKILEMQGATLHYKRSNDTTWFSMSFQAYEPQLPQEQLANWSEAEAKSSLSLLRVEMSDIIKEMDLQ